MVSAMQTQVIIRAKEEGGIERTESGYMAFTDNALEFQKRCAFKDGIEMEKVTEQKYVETQGGYSAVTGGETEKSEFP